MTPTPSLALVFFLLVFIALAIESLVVVLRARRAGKTQRESERAQFRPVREDASAWGGAEMDAPDERETESPRTSPLSGDTIITSGNHFGSLGLSESDIIRQLYKDPEESPKPEPTILILETSEAHGARIFARIREEARLTQTSRRPTPMIIVVDDEPLLNRRHPRAVRPPAQITHARSVTLKNGETLPCTVVCRCRNGSLILETPRGTMRKKKRYVRTAA